MPTNARRALDACNLPSRARILLLPDANNEKSCDTNQNRSRDSGELERKARERKTPATSRRLFCSKLIKDPFNHGRRRRLIVPVAPEHILQLLHFGVRLARAVPQIIIFHGAILLTHFGHSLYLPWRSVPSRAPLSPPAFRAASACRDAGSHAPSHASAPSALRSPGPSFLRLGEASAARDTFLAACEAQPVSWLLPV